MEYLADSNVIVNYAALKYDESRSLKLDKIFDKAFNTSIICKMEVLGYHGYEEEMAKLDYFLSGAVLFSITEKAVEKTIEIRKVAKIKLPGAIIAATAIVNSFRPLTHNIEDFTNVKGLEVISPEKL